MSPGISAAFACVVSTLQALIDSGTHTCFRFASKAAVAERAGLEPAQLFRVVQLSRLLHYHSANAPYMAQEVGLEPTTARLTAAGSTIELFLSRKTLKACSPAARMDSSQYANKQGNLHVAPRKRKRLWRRQQDSNLRNATNVQLLSRQPQ